MSAPATACDFLKLTRTSGLLDEERFANRFPDAATLPADPKACAASLVEAGLLTEYQAEQLLAGKHRGFVLGAYKVLRPAGSGGAVFLAEHTGLRRKSALKVLPAEQARDRRALDRFYREARAAAALDHPNIVRLHDVSQGGGAHFLVMEYVEGRDLQSVLDGAGPVPFARAVHYAAQAAAGLRHAHEKGFVHRDVRPAKLVLAKGGQVKILDMGLARSFRDDSDGLTQRLADADGAADYLAPEQAVNEPADERTDIYGLGATLFALIAGRPPRPSESPPASVPPELAAVIARMTAPRSGDRYSSAAAVIEALAPWIPEGAVLPDPVGTADLRASAPTARTRPRVRPPAGGPVNRKKGLLTGVVVGVVVVAGVLAAFGFSGKDRPPATELAAGGPHTAPPAAAVERYVQLQLTRVANVSTVHHLFGNPDAKARLVFNDWGPKKFNGVTFKLIDPKGGTVNNAFALYSANRPEETARYPRSVKLRVNTPVAAVHILGGVSGWGWPYRATGDKSLPGAAEGTESVYFRIRYADGGPPETHVWRNGEHLTDYNKMYDAAGSVLAFELEPGRYVRYLAVRPERDAVVKEVEFAKAPADPYTCPIFLAVTVERP